MAWWNATQYSLQDWLPSFRDGVEELGSSSVLLKAEVIWTTKKSNPKIIVLSATAHLAAGLLTRNLANLPLLTFVFAVRMVPTSFRFVYLYLTFV